MNLGKVRVSGFIRKFLSIGTTTEGTETTRCSASFIHFVPISCVDFDHGNSVQSLGRSFPRNFKSWNSIGYVCPTILQVQSGDIGNPGIEVDEEFQETQ